MPASQRLSFAAARAGPSSSLPSSSRRGPAARCAIRFVPPHRAPRRCRGPRPWRDPCGWRRAGSRLWRPERWPC
jgi:hypothetical protein